MATLAEIRAKLQAQDDKKSNNFLIGIGSNQGVKIIPWKDYGIVIGAGMGIGWCMLFYMTGHADLLYFNDLISNNVICSRPQKQTFKCSIYKNGELVKNL